MGNIVQSGGARSRAEIQADLTEAMRNEPKNQSRISALQSELGNSEPDENTSDNGGENNNSAVAEPNNNGSNNGGSSNGGSSNGGSTVAQPNNNGGSSNGGSNNGGSNNSGSNSNSTVAQPNDNNGGSNSNSTIAQPNNNGGSNNSGSSNGGSTIAQPDSNNRETINTQETDPCDQKKKLEKCKELAAPKPDLEKIKAAPSWSLSNWLFQIFDTDYWNESEQEECKAILENPPEINSTMNCPNNNNDRGLNNVSLPNFSEDNSEVGVHENAENNRGLSDVPVPTFPNNRKGGARTTHKNRVARRRTRKTAEREAAV